MHIKTLLKLNRLRMMSILVSTALIVACSYSVSVNDNLVYTPPALFTDYTINDQRLAQCVAQTIMDGKINAANALTLLNCSSANIQSLAGLHIFSALQELNLANNQLTEVNELAQLSQLRVLILNNNPLKDITPLLSLLQLHTLELADTPQLTCDDLQQLERNWIGLKNNLIKPKHCR